MPDIFDTPNKQKVREELWVPCFKEIILDLQKRKRFKRAFRYLCLPGPNSICVKYLLDNSIINGSTYIVGIEKTYEVVPQIQEFFSSHFKYRNNFVYCGKLQKLIKVNQQFFNKFPFDIAELDISGSFLSIAEKNGNFIYIDALQRFLSHQALNCDVNPFRIRRFYLIITSNIKGGFIPLEYLSPYDEDLTSFIKEEILMSYRDKLDHPSFNSLLRKERFNERERNLIAILGINLKIINFGSQNFVIRLNNNPYCYRGRRGGAKMVSMTYICERTRPTLGTNGNMLNFRGKVTNNLIQSLDLVFDTIFLPEPES